jgi:hypothetical protein
MDWEATSCTLETFSKSKNIILKRKYGYFPSHPFLWGREGRPPPETPNKNLIALLSVTPINSLLFYL